MSHEIMELDRVALGRNQRAWHGLGTVVRGTFNSAEALRLAHLDWSVSTEALCLPDGRGGYLTVDNAYAVVRDDLAEHDGRRVLGTVTGRYEPIQNTDALTLADMIADAGGAEFETAGTLRNGRVVWLLASLPGTIPVKDDTVRPYLLISTSHDGTRALRVDYTPVRVVCHNTLNWALEGADQRATVRHTGNVRSKMLEAADVLKRGEQYFDRARQTYNRLADATLDRRFVQAYTLALWPDETDDGTPRPGNRKIRQEVEFLAAGAQRGGRQDATQGTAYGLANAVGEYLDHTATVRRTDGRSLAEARFDSVMNGSAKRMKDRAINLLLRQLDLADDGAADSQADADAKRIDDLIAQFDLD